MKAQIEHGLDEAKYGYWGFSPSSDPQGGYREYGVDQLGLDGGGYTSDEQRTSVDQPFDGCRAGLAGPDVVRRRRGHPARVVPGLPLRAEGRAGEPRQDHGRTSHAYGPGGFYDAAGTRSHTVAERYLSLDQGMVMAALGNALANDDMRRYVSKGAMEQKLRPLMEMEHFSAKENGQ